MKLGLNAGPFTPEHVHVVQEAERLGYDSVWGGENYGYDAFTPVAWFAAQTSTIGLGTIVSIMDARAPTLTAMTAITLDRLSNGRFTLGLGISGPQVVEGWYGRPFPRPLARTREYIDIVRKVMAREEPVSYEGEFYQLPYRGAGSSGTGKALKSIAHPLRPAQPVFLAAEGPKNVALAAEKADGWSAFYLSPHSDGYYRKCLDEGFARRPGGRPAGFEVIGQVQLAIDDDVERAADMVRPHIAFMVGGMGAAGANFHYEALARLGFEAECAKIAALWSAGDRSRAIASVPTRLVEAMAIVGPPAKIRRELEAWNASCVTILLPMVMGRPVDVEFVRLMAELTWNS